MKGTRGVRGATSLRARKLKEFTKVIFLKLRNALICIDECEMKGEAIFPRTTNVCSGN